MWSRISPRSHLFSLSPTCFVQAESKARLGFSKGKTADDFRHFSNEIHTANAVTWSNHERTLLRSQICDVELGYTSRCEGCRWTLGFLSFARILWILIEHLAIRLLDVFASVRTNGEIREGSGRVVLSTSLDTSDFLYPRAPDVPCDMSPGFAEGHAESAHVGIPPFRTLPKSSRKSRASADRFCQRRSVGPLPLNTPVHLLNSTAPSEHLSSGNFCEPQNKVAF